MSTLNFQESPRMEYSIPVKPINANVVRKVITQNNFTDLTLTSQGTHLWCARAFSLKTMTSFSVNQIQIQRTSWIFHPKSLSSCRNLNN